jgi:3-dehydroquinate dehydratase
MAYPQKLEIEQHEAVGRRLKELNVELAELRAKLAGAYGKSSAELRHLRAVDKSLVTVRSLLEGRYFAEHKAKAAVTTYFGPLE